MEHLNKRKPSLLFFWFLLPFLLYSMMNLEKVNVIAADGSRAIAMFKLPGGAVIAHGSQQLDRKKAGLEEKSISASSQRVKKKIR